MKEAMTRAAGPVLLLAAAGLAMMTAPPSGAAAEGAGAKAGGGTSVVCVGVIYKVKAGHEAEAEGYLRRLQEETRKEPGTVLYIVHRSTEDPRQFLIYEQYRSQADFDSHLATEHFQRYGKNGIRTIAESRTGGSFTPL
jgi:quinol monooxygenase YgiN